MAGARELASPPAGEPGGTHQDGAL